MLFLGHNNRRIRDCITINPDKMRYDSMDGAKWRSLKREYPEVQLTEHLIHSFFLDQIDEKLLNGVLPLGNAYKMVDIVIDLRAAIEDVVRMQKSSDRLLDLLGELDEMANYQQHGRVN